MNFQTLVGEWQFRQTGTDGWMSCTVPGCVHTNLMNLGLIPDPFIGDNEKRVMWVAEQDWEYSYTFKVDINVWEEEKIFLVADGIDTLAKIYLNGNLLGNVNNQFRQWRWEVTDLLNNDENRLNIYFSGPAKYVAAEQKRRRMKGVSQAIDGSPHLRKAPCQFGWDWGPMLPPIGIWKDIRLEGRSAARFKDIHIQQIHADGIVTIQAKGLIEDWAVGNYFATIKVTTPDRQVIEDNKSINRDSVILSVRVNDPKLWWPNGLGEQHLYDVNVILKDDHDILDIKDYRVGLRTVELLQKDDEYGKSFQFIINGVPVFTKGSNWIPADSFLTRFSDLRLERLISDAAASHQNMLRVWGGGLYEEERFYDLCDKYGIMVWQDFIFSCSIYPLDENKFQENVRIEVEENIRRIRHRASLVLWCGNNEMEVGWESWGWSEHPLEDQLPALIEQYPGLRFLIDSVGKRDLLPDWAELKNAYDQFFHQTLPEWVAIHDPDTPYWPSSPSSNTPFHNANSQTRGDAHYWDVWHGRKPFTAYRNTFPRFMSEFGFQAFPTIETIQYYAEPNDRNLTSYIMEHHQRGNHGNGLIIAQMTDTFRMPKDFPAWIYLSLILQAEGIRYGVEHWRRHMHRVAGTLYWQLNDCWPVASWSSIDYFGRWKALHYLARRFYAPVLLSIEDQSEVMNVHISNDLPDIWEGTLRWWLETLEGEAFESGSLDVVAKPLSDTRITTFDFGDIISTNNQRDMIFICELWDGDNLINRTLATFVPNKHIQFTDPKLHVTVHKEAKEFVFTFEALSMARFVELKLKGVDVVFSDNYFDVPAGRIVNITCPIPDGWTLERARSTLSVYSLYDSYS